MTNNRKPQIGTIAIFLGWALTLLTIIWQVAVKDATYTQKISQIERDVVEVSIRIDETENFRLTIVEQLSEIRTDLTWIKQRLDQLDTN